MRTRTGMVAVMLLTFALTGCTGTERVEPGALTPAPTVTVTVEVPAPAPTPSVAPMPAGITEAEALYLDTARIFDLDLTDAELLETGWGICETRRAGEPVEKTLWKLEYPATQALCRDVL